MNLEDVNFDYFPRSPQSNKKWIGAGYFLGTGYVWKKDFLSFKEAKKFVCSLGLKSQKEWNEYCKSGKKPDNIPNNPYGYYKNKGWINWGYFLTGKNISYLSFKEAKKFVCSLGLQSVKEWLEYCKSGEKPDDIPNDPYYFYKNKGWKSFGDFLGTGYVWKKDFLSFGDGKKFIHKLGLQSVKEWLEYCKSGEKPDDIPNAPWSKYKDDWKGWGDWLGTGTVAVFNKVFCSFDKAKNVIHKLNLKTQTEWREYSKSGKRPNNIPSSPDKIYKDSWMGWGDWLGNRNFCKANSLLFEEVKIFVHKLKLKSRKEWNCYCKSGNKPNNIPNAPWAVYKDWKGLKDFLGY